MPHRVNATKDVRTARSLQLRKRIMALHDQGMTPRDVAVKTGVSRQTVYKHLTAGGARLRRKTADLDLLCGKIGLRYGRVRAELMAQPMELADYVLSRAPKAQTFAEALVQIAKEAYLQK